MNVLEIMRTGPVIPVIAIEDLAHAVPLAKANALDFLALPHIACVDAPGCCPRQPSWQAIRVKSRRWLKQQAR